MWFWCVACGLTGRQADRLQGGHRQMDGSEMLVIARGPAMEPSNLVL